VKFAKKSDKATAQVSIAVNMKVGRELANKTFLTLLGCAKHRSMFLDCLTVDQTLYQFLRFLMLRATLAVHLSNQEYSVLFAQSGQ
jgi:hypothetical protein